MREREMRYKDRRGSQVCMMPYRQHISDKRIRDDTHRVRTYYHDYVTSVIKWYNHTHEEAYDI